MRGARKSGVLNAPVYSYQQLPSNLFNGRKEGSVVRMDETQIIAASTLLAVFSEKREHVFVYDEEICDASVATGGGEAGVLEEPGLLHVASNVARSSLQELHIVLPFDHHDIVHYVMDKVNDSGVGYEHDGEGVFFGT